jgi:hypothetical protein
MPSAFIFSLIFVQEVPMSTLYYIRYQGRKHGPITEHQLITLLSRGQVSEDTETSHDGDHWLPIASLPEIGTIRAKLEEKLSDTTTGLTRILPPAPPKPKVAPVAPAPVPSPLVPTEPVPTTEFFTVSEPTSRLPQTAPPSAEVDLFARAGLDYNEDTSASWQPASFEPGDILSFLKQPRILWGGGLIIVLVIGFFCRTQIVTVAKDVIPVVHRMINPKVREEEERAAQEKLRLQMEANKKKQEEEAAAAKKAAEEKEEAERIAAEEEAERIENARIQAINGLEDGFYPAMFPFPSDALKVVVLSNSTGLWDYRDEITVEYVPYAPYLLEGQDQKNYRLFVEQKVSAVTDDSIQYCTFSAVVGDEAKHLVATIVLSQKKGLMFEWKIPAQNDFPPLFLNRILLGQIKVANDSLIKFVSLFQPVRYDLGNPSGPYLGKPLQLWDNPAQTEFWSYLTNLVVEAENGTISLQKLPIQHPFEADTLSETAMPGSITFPGWKNHDGEDFRGNFTVNKGGDNEITVQFKLDRDSIDKSRIAAEKEQKKAETNIKNWIDFQTKNRQYWKNTVKGSLKDRIKLIDLYFEKIPFPDDPEMTPYKEKSNEQWVRDHDSIRGEWGKTKTYYRTATDEIGKIKKVLDEVKLFEQGPYNPVPFSVYLPNSTIPGAKLLLLEVK